MIKFLIESSICLALFYSVYWLFLRNEKFLSINRFFLLGAVAFSMLIPLLEFGIQPRWASAVQVFSPVSYQTTTPQVKTVEEVSRLSIFSKVYYVGLMVSMLALFVKFHITKKRLGLNLLKGGKGLKFIQVEGYHAYSFWNVIVLGKSIEDSPELRETVVSHEMAHIKGKHSLDLILMELLKCFYWFNPFIYFSATSLKTQHEYIADEQVLEEFSPRAYERSLATITLAKIDQSLVHGFGKRPLDKRIKMIYTTNSNIMKKSKLLLALPIVALLIFQFSCSEEPVIPEEEFVESAVLEPNVIVVTETRSADSTMDSVMIKLVDGELIFQVEQLHGTDSVLMLTVETIEEVSSVVEFQLHVLPQEGKLKREIIYEELPVIEVKNIPRKRGNL